jgi:long-chain acyl-CoA synthetase
MELFGQTESCGTITLQKPDDVKPGMVGQPIRTVRIKLADDGEVLVHGKNVFKGYYKNADATAGTIENGWLHTGDIGRLEDGQLRIVDRKKDIMITDGGKNIAPAEIESLMRTSDLIQECILVADGRKYVTALIQIDPAAFTAHAKTATYEEIAAMAETAAQVAAEIRRLNETLARVAQVKRAFIIPSPLRYDLGDLTPTLKLRRFMVHQRHRDQIEAVYKREAGFDIYPGERL